MRIMFLMELILALAVGFGMTRSLVGPPENPAGEHDRGNWFCYVGNSTAAGVGLVIGLGTWWERARRRSSLPWGPGRWVWSAAATYVILLGARGAARVVAIELGGQRWSWVFKELMLELRTSNAIDFGQSFGMILGVIAISYGIARPPPGPKMDAREWAGRGFAVLVVLLGLADFANDLWLLRLEGIGDF